MNIDSFTSVNITLAVNSATYPSFDRELFLVDTNEVPIDQRIRVLTKDDGDELTDDTVEKDFWTAFFGQTGNKPEALVLGRLVKTAIPPAFVCPTHDETVASWAALTTTGTFTVVDSDTNSTDVTIDDLTGVTTFAQVITKLNSSLAGLTTPDVVGLDSAEFEEDALGRLVLKMPSGQDDTDPTISITYDDTPGTAPYLMGITTSGAGTSVSGNAIETLLESYTAVKTKTLAFYNIALEDRTGDTYTERVALAAQVETERRQLTFVDTESDASTSGVTTDLQSRLATLNYKRSLVIYDEHTTNYCDAAADGRFLPAEPGTRQYGHSPLTGVLPSGTVGSEYDLSSTKITVLEGKGNNYVARAGGSTFVHRGKTADGLEKRMVMGRDWMESYMQVDIFNLDMNEDFVGFDEETLGAISGIFEKYLEEAIERKIIISYELNMPSLDDFTSAEKTSGDMVLSNVFTAIGRFEAHTFTITGSITV